MRCRFNNMLGSFLVVGSVCYISILWKGQHSLFYDKGRLTKETFLAPPTEETLAKHLLEISRSGGFRSGIESTEMKLRFHDNPMDNRPPYDLVANPQTYEITGNVESLIHYAIIGFGKCGTTSMVSWLNEHKDLQSYPLEVYDLMLHAPEKLLRRIYTMPLGNYKRGFKSPSDLSLIHTMDYFKKYWPKTKLIVGIRHPVVWFESLYNFRIQNIKPHRNHTDFPRPNELIGRCFKTSRNTCTYKGEFGIFLRNLGKTLAVHNLRNPVTGAYNLTTFEERMYKGAKFLQPIDVQESVPNPVFLFEMRQLSDDVPSRVGKFRNDIKDFLELDSPLPPIVHHKPGRIYEDSNLQAIKDSLKINICDDEFIPVRTDLMRMARVSSVWIREYLLDPRVLATSNVVVSSKRHLISLLKDWMDDPCGGDATKGAGRFVLEAARLELKEKREQTEYSTT